MFRKFKNKIKDFFDDVAFYVWNVPVDRYYSIRQWFRTNFNKHHFKVVKESLFSYPWDYYYLWEGEMAKLNEMYQYHLRSHIIAEEERVKILRTLSWAIKMLNIVINSDDLFEMKGDFILKQSDNFSGAYVKDKEKSTITYVCKVKVNTKNTHRFIKNNIDQSVYQKYPHELYALKAKALYHRIRYYYDGLWWD